MRSDCEEIPGGFSKDDADKAETMEAELHSNGGHRPGGSSPRGGRSVPIAPARQPAADAADCSVYWPAPYYVCGAIRDKYDSLGGPNSFLLWPTSDELVNPDGVGRRSTFQNGPIYWHPDAGAHPVVNHFFAAWQRNGWEGGVLGYPTSDEIVNPDNVGRRQYFQGGTVYWKLNEAYYVAGAVRDKWGETGWEGGYLGYPTSDETGTPDGLGRFNRFEHGVIYCPCAYGAHPVSGGLLTKWEQSGFEHGPYGYPIGDQYQSGSSWYQEFQFGTMGFPADPAAGVDPVDPEADPRVDGGRPNTLQEFATDAAAGSVPGAVATDSSGSGVDRTPCTGNSSCIEPASQSVEDYPVVEGPDTGGTTTPSWCGEKPHDGRWYSLRKNTCMAYDSQFTVFDKQTGQPLGTLGFTVRTGILSSHRTGDMYQEFRISFGDFTGQNVGSPTLKYTLNYVGFGSDQYSVDGAPSGTPVRPKTSLSFLVKWKEHDMADNSIAARTMLIDYYFGNNAPNYTESTSDTLRANMMRCDTTLKNTQGNWHQGCVVANYTPIFAIGAEVAEQTGHVQAATGSGLPGTAGRPLHRQSDPNTFDINRQTACPRRASVADARRVDGRSCDEYPFASSTEGAASSGGSGRTFNPQCHVPDLGASTDTVGYSVCMINDDHNITSGRMLGNFYTQMRVINQDPYTIDARNGTLPATVP
ncbi:hypothetical protein GL305_19980 [Nocardia seriolae]|uniref:LGFP repeat-containing protein n=1 Tax=Nocardia seriolae TaxID=37332 RepID=UPI0012BCEBFB|nr:LGFP repeat-containing protein [Nocardia seriolae]MTK32173.1 hypothetical protein [Nocardia seriolae]